MSDHKHNPRALAFKQALRVDGVPPRLRDAVGKVLEVGDEVLCVMPSCLFRVAEIAPITEPGAPPNAMKLVLVTRTMLAAPRDSGVDNLYFLRHQAEIGDGAIEGAAEETEAHDVQAPPGDESGPAEKSSVIITD